MNLEVRGVSRCIELDHVMFELECVVFEHVVILLLWLQSRLWFLIVEGVVFVLLNLELAVAVRTRIEFKL